MKTIKQISRSQKLTLILAVGILQTAASLLGAGPVIGGGGACAGDDFDDNSKDTARWGAQISPGTPRGQLQEIDGRLQFTGSSFAAWPWTCSQLSYKWDWAVTVDCHVGDVPLQEEESWAQVTLAVGNASDPHRKFGWPGDFVSMNFDIGNWGGINRSFNGDIQRNWTEIDLDDLGVPDEGFASGQHGSMRITFTATNKTLTMWCDSDGPTNGYSWTPFCTLRIDSQGYDWEMDDQSTFRLLLVGDCGGVTVTSNQFLWMDNFTIEAAGPATSLLDVQVAGKGTIKPDLDGAALVIGDSYKVSAKRGKGYQFVDWAGTVEGAEVFRTNSAKLNFVMQSNLVLTATFVDVMKPVLKVTAPKRNQHSSQEIIAATGTVRDNGTGGAVWYQLNDATPVMADGWTNWTAQVSLAVGANTLRTWAIDDAGNSSKTNAIPVIRDE